MSAGPSMLVSSARVISLFFFIRRRPQQLNYSMSTRTTRSKANSAQNPAAAASPAPPSKTVTKASKVNSKSQDLDVQAGKENNSVKVPAAGKSTAQVKGKARATSSTTSDQPFCTCKKGDDGTPMIHCTECKDWYVGF